MRSRTNQILLFKKNKFLLDSISSFINGGNSLLVRRNIDKEEYVVFKTKNAVNINQSQYNVDIYEYVNYDSNSNLYLQKNVGIIGWVNKEDTFNLVKYQIVKAN